MKIHFLLILAFAGLALTGCNQTASSVEESRSKTPEELKAELKENEENSPTEYLNVSCKWSENNVKVKEEGLFSNAEYKQDGYNITGTIQNSASVATFKDVVITINYLSQTESIISSEDFTIYEYAKPGQTADFEFIAYPPEAFVSMSFEIIGATPSN